MLMTSDTQPILIHNLLVYQQALPKRDRSIHSQQCQMNCCFLRTSKTMSEMHEATKARQQRLEHRDVP